MSHSHEHKTASELYKQHALHAESPGARAAGARTFAAVGICAAVFVGAYVFVASQTYDFFEVKQSIAGMATEVRQIGEKLAPDVEEGKSFWAAFRLHAAEEASAQVQENVVEEMKKQIEAKSSEHQTTEAENN